MFFNIVLETPCRDHHGSSQHRYIDNRVSPHLVTTVGQVRDLAFKKILAMKQRQNLRGLRHTGIADDKSDRAALGCMTHKWDLIHSMRTGNAN